jgi:hypothetical protein
MVTEGETVRNMGKQGRDIDIDDRSLGAHLRTSCLKKKADIDTRYNPS